jgi:hypothetical protein
MASRKRRAYRDTVAWAEGSGEALVWAKQAEIRLELGVSPDIRNRLAHRRRR